MTCKSVLCFLCIHFLTFTSLFSLSLEDKMNRLSSHESVVEKDRQALEGVDIRLKEKRAQIEELQRTLWDISQHDKELQSPFYKDTCEHLMVLHKELQGLQKEWLSQSNDSKDEEFESMWQLPDTTIGQVVIDYNPGDCVYIMPPEIAQMKLHISSHISVPRSAWSQMMELILATSGIGIKQLSPFVKQLYFLRLNQSGFNTFLDTREELACLLPEQKVAFVVTPPATDMRRILQFLEKFAPQEQIGLQTLSSSIVIVGLAREVQELLKIYDFITTPKHCQEYRFIALEKADSAEVAHILLAMIDGGGSNTIDAFSGGEKGIPFFPGADTPTFRVLPLKHPASSLFLIGRPDQLEKAASIIKEIESNIGEVQEKSVFWYACKHSEAEELAKVLSQVYTKLLASTNAFNQESGKSKVHIESTKEIIRRRPEMDISHQRPKDSLIVAPTEINPLDSPKTQKSGEISEQFIVDPKTNSIIMVVEKFLLPKLKELITKLDLPKKMVQLDVLLFEKKVSDASEIGLSQFNTNEKRKKNFDDGVGWNDLGFSKGSKHNKNDSDRGSKAGILEFAFMSHGAHGFMPPYQLAYQFLLSQEDVQINANPSVTTVNQTPAKIAIVDQISINNGSLEDHKHSSNRDSYSRAEYGIIINITPTIHAKMEDDSDPKFVTLATDVTFDTTHPNKEDRPDVTRRNIKNEVRVRDGETVILGGLRRKHSSGSKQAIPFLGEIPGLGLLFSHSALSDLNTEMFIFVTPHILPDAHEEWEKLRKQELMHRPGDIPEFFKEIEEAKQKKKKHLFEASIKMLFSTPSIVPE